MQLILLITAWMLPGSLYADFRYSRNEVALIRRIQAQSHASNKLVSLSYSLTTLLAHDRFNDLGHIS
jgi:hypothetical protein